MKHLLVILSILVGAQSIAFASSEASTSVDQASQTSTETTLADSQGCPLTAQGFSPASLLALGSAQLEADAVGPALLNLRRASVLAPRDKTIRSALRAANEQAGIAAPRSTWYRRAATFLSPREWALAGVSATIVASLASLLMGFGTYRRLGRSLAVVGVFGASVAFTGWHQSAEELKGSMVIVDGAVAKQAPFSDAETIFSLPVGEVIHIEKSRGDYRYVKTSAGDRGWVRGGDVAGLSDDRICS